MLDRLLSLIWRRPVEGAAAPAVDAPAPQPVTEEAPLAPLLRAAGFGDVGLWAGVLAAPMRNFEINTKLRRAAFLATIAHESSGGRRLEENLSFSADRIMAVWPRRFRTREDALPFARNPAGLAEKVYGGRMGNTTPGAAWAYRGRGLIQITGADNYRSTGEALDLPLLTQPGLAAEPEHAAVIAACWWAAHGCNALADREDVEGWRRRVNGGLIGLDDVRRRYTAVLACA